LNKNVAANALDRARRRGAERGVMRALLLAHGAEALLELGLTGRAAELTDEIRDHVPEPDDWAAHMMRARVDVCQDAIERAVARVDAVRQLGLGGHMPAEYESQRTFAWVAVWAGDPRGALEWVEQSLARFVGTDTEMLCGEFLAIGARAVADLAGSARARRDEAGELHAGLARDRLLTALADMGGRPFTDHPYAARVPGDRADWEAELGRSVGRSDPDAWQEAGATWQRLGRPHRAAYALWRQSEALMTRSTTTHEAATALRAAAQAATGMAPLMSAIQRLAERARISLDSIDEAKASPPRPIDPYDLTKRERLVLRLLAKGYTNARIGAELYMSPKTASVHVTNILRKLQVLNRTEAAAVAERAGLIENERGA